VSNFSGERADVVDKAHRRKVGEDERSFFAQAFRGGFGLATVQGALCDDANNERGGKVRCCVTGSTH